MASPGAALNWLVAIAAPTPIYVAVRRAVYGGNAYEPYLIGTPTITRRIPGATGGFVQADNTSIVIANVNGAISTWFDAAQNNDPRGAEINVYTCPLEDGPDGTPTLRWTGRLDSFDGAIDAQSVHIARVNINATADSADAGSTLIPSELFEYDTFSGIPDDELVMDSLSLAFPVVFGGTRQHTRAISVRNGITSGTADYIACHTPADVFLRAYVNSVYTIDLGALRVLPQSNYSILDNDAAYPNKVAIRSQIGAIESLWLDIECTEYNWKRNGVARQWLFRNSLTDDKAKRTLFVGGATEGAWEFEQNISDSSGNGRTLSAQDGNSDTPAYLLEDAEAGYYLINWAAKSATVENTAYFYAGNATDAWCEIGAGESFYIEARVAREPNQGKLAGCIAGKAGATTLGGYGLYFYNNAPTFVVEYQDTGVKQVSVAGPPIADDEFHLVIASFDRTDGKLYLYVDGVLVGEEAIPGALGSIANGADGIKFSVCASNGASDRFYGKVGRVRFYNVAYGKDVVYSLGQSKQGVSAARLATGSLSLTTAQYAGMAVSASQHLMMLVRFKRLNNTSDEKLFELYNAAGGYRLYLLTNGTLQSSVSDGVDSVTINPATAYDDGNWHTAVVILDRTAQRLRMYVDGVLKATSGSTSAIGALGNTAGVVIQTQADLDEITIQIHSTDSSMMLTDADVATHYYNSVGNPVACIRRIIENDTWGLNGTVDTTSFNDIRDEFLNSNRSLVCGGALEEQQMASVVLSDFLKMYGMVLKQTTSEAWVLTVSWQSPTGVTKEIGYLDGRLNNVASIASVQRTPLSSTPQYVNVLYQRINDPNVERDYVMLSGARSVNAKGIGNVYHPMPFVRDWATADRICHFLAENAKKDLSFVAVCARTLIDTQPGDLVEVNVPDLSFSAKQCIAKQVAYSGDTVTIELIETAPNALVYSAGPVTWPDYTPDSTPDYRYTYPDYPINMELVVNTALVFGTRVSIEFDLPTDQTSKDLIVGYRVYWFYLVSNDEDQDALPDALSDEVRIDERPATPGAHQRWTTTDMDPGRKIRAYIISVGRNGLVSSNGRTIDNVQYLEFTTAVGASIVQGNYGLNQRVLALEAGGAGGATTHYKITPSPAFDGVTTAFTGFFPVDVDIATSGREPIIVLDNVWLHWVASAPNAFQFTTSGTGNRDVTFGRAPDTGADAYAIVKPA